MVFFHHFRDFLFPEFNTSLWNRTPFRLIFDGQAAVCVFFVISGYVLSVRSFETGKFSLKENLLPFLIKRSFRLLLPFWAALLLMYFFLKLGQFLGLGVTYTQWPSFIPFQVMFKDVLRQFIVMVPAPDPRILPQDWSLTVEYNFSLWIPFFIVAFIESPLAFLLIAFLKLQKSAILFGFIGGMVSAKYINFWKEHLKQLSFFWWLLGILVSISGLAVKGYGLYREPSLPPSATTGFEWFVMGVSATILITFFSVRPKFFENSGCQFLGKISYSVYLLHYLVLYGFSIPLATLNDGSHGALLLNLFFSTLLLFCICLPFYTFVEVPSILWGAHYAKTLSFWRSQK